MQKRAVRRYAPRLQKRAKVDYAPWSDNAPLSKIHPSRCSGSRIMRHPPSKNAPYDFIPLKAESEPDQRIPPAAASVPACVNAPIEKERTMNYETPSLSKCAC